MKKAGSVILVIGLLATMFTGFNYVTREKVVDIGELEIIGNKRHTINWQPALGLGVMLIGGIVYAFGSKSRRGPTLLSN